MMQKSALVFLALPVLLSACAATSEPVASLEPASMPVAELAQPAAPLPAQVEAKPAASKPAVDRVAAAPDFYQSLMHWSGAMQASLAPWTAAIKQCDTRGSGK
jgi:hypothetical protein